MFCTVCGVAIVATDVDVNLAVYGTFECQCAACCESAASDAGLMVVRRQVRTVSFPQWLARVT